MLITYAIANKRVSLVIVADAAAPPEKMFVLATEMADHGSLEKRSLT